MATKKKSETYPNLRLAGESCATCVSSSFNPSSHPPLDCKKLKKKVDNTWVCDDWKLDPQAMR